MASPRSGSSSTGSRSNLEMLVFVEGGKPENPEKNPRSKDENQQQTQPTYDTGTENRTRLPCDPCDSLTYSYRRDELLEVGLRFSFFL